MVPTGSGRNASPALGQLRRHATTVTRTGCKAEQKARRARKPELTREQDNARYRRNRDKRIELATKHSHIRQPGLRRSLLIPALPESHCESVMATSAITVYE